MTHTDQPKSGYPGFSEPEPAPRWRYLDPMEGVAHEPGERYLVRGTVSAVARVIAAEVMADRILTTLNAAEDAQRELGLHKLNDKGQCPICYDAGYEDGATAAEDLRDKLALTANLLTGAQLERDAAVSACEVLRTRVGELERGWARVEAKAIELHEARATIARLGHAGDALLERVRLAEAVCEAANDYLWGRDFSDADVLQALETWVRGRGETDGGERRGG